MTQAEIITHHLQQHGSITPLEAQSNYNVWRLAAVVNRLKNRGFNITSQMNHFEDYAYRMGVSGRTANEITGQEHLEVLALAANYVDSAVSKTCNIGDDVPYEDFKTLYYDAWKLGCKGITTFRAAGKRYGILNKPKEEEPAAEACYFDPETGQKSCE